jgi:hypothetical protein
MALLNYTTKIEPEQTISEIQKMLSRHGVTAMMTEYDGPNVSSVSFRMNVGGKPMGFRLPCNWRAVQEIFKHHNAHRTKVRGRLPDRFDESGAQATRTAWRIIKDWIEAQLALVEVNMATVPQVFLPYAIMKDNRTLSEHVASDPSFLLGDGK